jgi:hypothetical protein
MSSMTRYISNSADVTNMLQILTSTMFRDIGFSDFVHRPDSKLLKTQRFGNWICFHPQVREDTYFVGSLRKSYPQLLDSPCQIHKAI